MLRAGGPYLAPGRPEPPVAPPPRGPPEPPRAPLGNRDAIGHDETA
jgi:hypothetical protein